MSPQNQFRSQEDLNQPKRFYWLETYGCQMNMAESSALEQQLSQYDWLPASKAEKAQLIVLNTCAVRKSAETRIWGRLAYFKSINRNGFKVAVMGCMAERLQEKMKMQDPSIDIVVGNFSKQSFIQMLEGDKISQNQLNQLSQEELHFHFAENHGGKIFASTFVPIMHGCNNFCTYCIVPHVRGREVSRPLNSILKELNHLQAQGVQEVTLLGQNVNSYQFKSDEETIDFPRLLEIICKNSDIPWIRFTSSHPKDVSPHLAEIISKHKQICNHLHLPMQHGSDSVLTRMNRKYSIKQYIQLINIIREKNPEIGLSTDLLIGFPGETEDDFNQTLNIIKKIRFDDAFTYYYNRRSGTKAARMDGQLDEKLKKNRLAKLIEVQRLISEENKAKEIGEVVTVLTEKVSRKNDNEWLGRSEKNRMVIFSSNDAKPGQFLQVKLISLMGSTFKGEVI